MSVGSVLEQSFRNCYSGAMSRPREFDEPLALKAAMRVFWRKGYDATSIPDLLDATGLSRSSLYETFGDKAALFEAATKMYFETEGALRREALQHKSSAREGFRNFFALQIESCMNPENPGGCLLTNTATSLESHDPRIEQLVREGAQGMVKEIRCLLKRARDAGEIAPERDIDALAQMLMGVSFGINVMARINPSRKTLEAMASSAIESIA